MLPVRLIFASFVFVLHTLETGAQQCGPNEEWKECSGCELRCSDVGHFACPAMCYPAKCECTASRGLRRDSSGNCVHISDCPPSANNGFDPIVYSATATQLSPPFNNTVTIVHNVTWTRTLTGPPWMRYSPSEWQVNETPNERQQQWATPIATRVTTSIAHPPVAWRPVTAAPSASSRQKRRLVVFALRVKSPRSALSNFFDRLFSLFGGSSNQKGYSGSQQTSYSKSQEKSSKTQQKPMSNQGRIEADSEILEGKTSR